MNEALCNHIMVLERQLHSSEVRVNSAKLEGLLHDAFKEIGRSGQVYDKSDVLDKLSVTEDYFEIISEKFQFMTLSDTIILVTYRSYQLNKRIKSHNTMRSSMWVSEQDRWKIIFHQGTAFNEDEPSKSSFMGSSKQH